VIMVADWVPQKRFSIRRIGVGYKDKGHLGTGLSWKDQILPVEDLDPEPESFAYLLLLTLGKLS